MTLQWTDNIHDCSSTHEDGPISDLESFFIFYRLLAGMPDGERLNIAFRVEGKVIGFTVAKHDEMGEAP